MIRVVLVDDETLVRKGLESLLRLAPDIEVVGEARDGDEALAVIERTSPSVVLLDLKLPRRSGLAVLETLAARGPGPACLVLTTFDDDESALAAIRLGARGYLRKDVSLERLLEAVRTLAAGRALLQPAVTEGVLRGLGVLRQTHDSGRPALSNPEPLTPREREVLRLMASGYSNREIASALGTAAGTIKIHVSNVLAKLDARDRVRAVLRALELGLLG